MKEKIKNYLSNLYENYKLDTRNYVRYSYKAKCLGAMETLLILLNEIKPGVPYDYHKKDLIFSFFGKKIAFKNIRYETYEEYILRITDEFLKKDGSF